MVRMPHWPKPIWYSKITFGFERLEPLLNGMGNPHLKMPPVIHVAGTNGKGSTVSFIRNILEKSGYKVHTYTSPHLVDFNERILINGKQISDEYLFEVMERTRIACENLAIEGTFFEVTTAAAFLAFSENQADFVVLETGMGGRLDATNIVQNKIATAITPISYDHMEFLGETLSKIALEKAAIMLPGVPAIISLQTDEAMNALQLYCEHYNIENYAFSYDWVAEKQQNGFTFKTHNFEYNYNLPSLQGDHQIINAATAIATVKSFTNINDDIINAGITSTYWIGRLEEIKKGSYYAKYNYFANIWLDGAHNQSGAQIIGEWINNQNLPTYLILGMTRNRNIEDFLEYAAKNVKAVIGFFVEDEPSSYKANVVEERARNAGYLSYSAENFDHAFEIIQGLEESSGNSKCNILVTGSLFLVGMFHRLNRG